MDIIIGAGISGLTYANYTSNDYLIIEKEDYTGGLCNTIKQDGFVWDYSGHFFHFQDPQIAQFIGERIDSSQLLKVTISHQHKANSSQLASIWTILNISTLQQTHTGFVTSVHGISSTEENLLSSTMSTTVHVLTMMTSQVISLNIGTSRCSA